MRGPRAGWPRDQEGKTSTKVGFGKVMRMVYWLLVWCLSGLLGALVGSLTDSVGWAFVALFATPCAATLFLFIAIGVLSILERLLVKSGFYRWRTRRCVAGYKKRQEAREALRRG